MLSVLGVAGSMGYDVCVLSYVRAETMTSGNVEIPTCFDQVYMGREFGFTDRSQRGQESLDDIFNEVSEI